LRKKEISIITLFTIIITCIALDFQWNEFYKGYSYNDWNFYCSIIFLLAWLLFSFYWGRIKRKEYRKFIIVYWGINIISSIFIWAFANNKLIQSFLAPLYIWYGGPLYGFRYLFFPLNRIIIDVPSLILILSPLGMTSCFICYWCGSRSLKIKKS